MRKRKPTIPRGAPKGTVWFGGPIEWFRMTLRIAGETLIPADVTKILQCQPSQAEEKGQPLPRKTGRPERIAKTGRWHFTLSPEDTDEWDCGEAILELLGRLQSDANVWRTLADRYQIGIFVGLNMTGANMGFSLSPRVMTYLAERGIEAGFDIYCDPVAKGG